MCTLLPPQLSPSLSQPAYSHRCCKRLARETGPESLVARCLLWQPQLLSAEPSKIAARAHGWMGIAVAAGVGAGLIHSVRRRKLRGTRAVRTQGLTVRRHELVQCQSPGQQRTCMSAASSSAASSEAEFWTLIKLGNGARLVALRNMVKQMSGAEELYYVGLDEDNFERQVTPVEPGEGFGQFCIISADAEERLLAQHKVVCRPPGQGDCNGADVTESSDLQQTSIASLIHDIDIEKLKNVADYKLPFGLENKFKIFLSPLRAEDELPEVIRKKQIPELKSLKFGLPSSCDAFREAPFTGDFHVFGIVPAIGKYQFVAGSGCDGTWVRFDLGDFETYSYDLKGIPVIKDATSITFPVSHLWVDFSFPTAVYGLEWFLGDRCIARKEISISPMPNFIYQQCTGLVRKGLNKIRTVPRDRAESQHDP
eukprot:TRINITY_DN78834_c0_g1_i1.p1 TRINITY_DN78834_c0_g1~~TRINITY_DN78834_c0_g1_i1.p1  ORF type:complete len:442 (+),score=67.62 TRINITY_DN78834_c0_g1_i1:53-1327(+)